MPILAWKEFKKRFAGNETSTYFDEAPVEQTKELMKLHGFRFLGVYKYEKDRESALQGVKKVVPDGPWVTAVFRECLSNSELNNICSVEIYVM